VTLPGVAWAYETEARPGTPGSALAKQFGDQLAEGCDLSGIRMRRFEAVRHGVA
jgi:hypothetical protein